MTREAFDTDLFPLDVDVPADDKMVTFTQHRERWRAMFKDMEQAAIVLQFLAPNKRGIDVADRLAMWAEAMSEWINSSASDGRGAHDPARKDAFRGGYGLLCDRWGDQCPDPCRHLQGGAMTDERRSYEIQFLVMDRETGERTGGELTCSDGASERQIGDQAGYLIAQCIVDLRSRILQDRIS